MTVSEPDFRRLDDPEPPVATDHRLDAVVTRGRKLRRRRTALTTGATMAAVVVVVALAGVVGLVRTHVGPTVGVPAAGGPASPTLSTAPPTAAADTNQSPPITGSKISQVLSTDGVGPYLIGTPSKLLQAKGFLAMKPTNATCPDTYAPTATSKLDPATLRIVVRPPGYVGLVEASGREYVTPSGAYIGMTEPRLAQIYGGQLLPAGPVDTSRSVTQTYTVGTALAVGFVVTDGQVSYLLAGSKGDVIERLKSGAFAGC